MTCGTKLRTGYARMTRDTSSSFFGLFAAFGERAYWTRLWNVQQVACAERIEILCGMDLLPRPALSDALLIDCSGMASEPFANARLWEDYSTRTRFSRLALRRPNVASMNYSGVISNFREFECLDQRDKVYAVLCLISWEYEDIPAVVPDYSISTFGLAVKIAGAHSVWDKENAENASH